MVMKYLFLFHVRLQETGHGEILRTILILKLSCLMTLFLKRRNLRRWDGHIKRGSVHFGENLPNKGQKRAKIAFLDTSPASEVAGSKP